MTDLTTTNTSNDTSVQNTHKVSIKRSLRDRMNSPSPQAVVEPASLANRLALLLDVSGSMAGSGKIESLRAAMESFVNNVNFVDTSLAIQTFGGDDAGSGRLPLTTFHPILLTTIMGLHASGSTPMHDAMAFALYNWPLTRCVLVSDGQPDSEASAYAQAENMREAEIPCDCVHIGHSISGEAVLRKIAELTGGKYIKFSDVSQFASQFKYLTPAFYGQLTSGVLHIGDK